MNEETIDETVIINNEQVQVEVDDFMLTLMKNIEDTKAQLKDCKDVLSTVKDSEIWLKGIIKDFQTSLNAYKRAKENQLYENQGR